LAEVRKNGFGDLHGSEDVGVELIKPCILAGKMSELLKAEDSQRVPRIPLR
jgi:hypothetical protein